MLISDMENILCKVGWTKKRLAEQLDISPVTVSRWEEVPGPVAAYLNLLERVVAFHKETVL